MARINSALSAATSSRVKRRSRELEALFGPAIVLVARVTDPCGLRLSSELMDKVHDAADKLLALSGKPQEQRKHVTRLPSDVRLVLCMWVMDINLAAKLTARAMQE